MFSEVTTVGSNAASLRGSQPVTNARRSLPFLNIHEMTRVLAFTAITALSASEPATAGVQNTSAYSNAQREFPQVRRQREGSRFYREASARIYAFEDYPRNWGAPGSVAASTVGVNSALEFLAYIDDLGMVTPPKINLSSDGEISFYWKTRSVVIDFGISRRGVASYYAKLANGTEFVVDRTRHPVSFPEPIEQALRTA